MNMITTKKRKRKIYIPQQDLKSGPLEHSQYATNALCWPLILFQFNVMHNIFQITASSRWFLVDTLKN